MNTYFDIYTNPKKIFEKEFRSVDQLKDDCIYMIDTNVLLLPYTVGSKELTEIERVYSLLLKEDKLYISAQVAKEFAKNRPKKLEEMVKSLSDYASKLKDLEMPKYPMFGQLPDYVKIAGQEEQCNQLIKEYKNTITKITEYIKKLNWNDQVSIIYSSLFKANFIIDNEWKYDDIKKEIEERLKFNLPPAYKDKGKDDGGIGDYVIWKDILKMGAEKQNNIIFVTGNEKADWFHQSMGAKIYPRYELLHEFKEFTGGKDIYFISLSDLIELFSENHEIVDNIRSVERLKFDRSNLQIRAQAILNAGSKCQLCHIDVSLDGNKGLTFLEIHHIKSLSNGGGDNLHNIIVLCPNCHKIIHKRIKEDKAFVGGSPCQMSGQLCPACKIGTMDVSQRGCQVFS